MEVDNPPNDNPTQSKDSKKAKPLCNGSHEESSLDEAPGSPSATGESTNGHSKSVSDSMETTPPVENDVQSKASVKENSSDGDSKTDASKDGKTVNSEDAAASDSIPEKGEEVTSSSRDGSTDKRSSPNASEISKEGRQSDAEDGGKDKIKDNDIDSAVEITDSPVKNPTNSANDKSVDDSGNGKSGSSVIVVESASESASATPRTGTPVNTPRSGTPAGRTSRTGTPVDSKISSRAGTPAAGQSKSRSATPNAEITPTKTPVKEQEKTAKTSKVSQMLEQTSRPIENFRPIAQLLYDIGMDVTRQTVYKDLIKIQKKKETMGKLDDKEKVQLGKLGDAYDELLVKNELYIHGMKSCKRCSFKTDSENVMTCHLEFAHDQHINLFTCVLCDATLPSAAQFLYHMDAEHKRRGRVFMKHSFFVCPNCPYESNNKTMFTKHTEKCNKSFTSKQNLMPLAPDRDIPLMTVRPALKAHPARPQRPVAPPRPVIRPPVPQARAPFVNRPAAVFMPPRPGVSPRAATSVTMRPTVAGVTVQRPVVGPVPSPRPVPARPAAPPRPVTPTANNKSSGKSVSPGGSSVIQMNGQYYKLAVVGTQQFLVPVSDPNVIQKSAQQKGPSPIVVQANSKAAAAAGVKSSTNKMSSHLQALQDGRGRDYEICEICGGFVKDKENLRVHFLFAHKVDIHKDVFKATYPPLHCNMCTNPSLRFWTYQGLARHRQEGHQLVTTPKHAAMKKLIDEISKQCIYCLEPFSSNIDARGFWSHMVIHGIQPASIFRTNKCCACGATIHDRAKMKLHLRTRHALLFAKVSMQNNVTAKNTPPNLQPNRPNKQLTPPSRKKCPHCSLELMTQELLNKHIANFHSYKCSRCPLRFDEIDAMHQHFASKHSQEKDECPICNVKIKVGRSFVRHMKSEHMKECSVVVTRLKKAILEQRQKEVQKILDDVAASKKTPNKRKRVTPQKVDKEKEKDKVIVLEEDSPPRKKPCPEPKASSAKNGKEVLEVDGEQIVVELQQDDEDDEDDSAQLKILSSRSLSENAKDSTGDTVNGENDDNETSLKITSTQSLAESADAQSTQNSDGKTNGDKSKDTSPDKASSIDNKKTAQNDVDRIVITDSSEMNDSHEVISLDDSVDSINVSSGAKTNAKNKEGNKSNNSGVSSETNKCAEKANGEDGKTVDVEMDVS